MDIPTRVFDPSSETGASSVKILVEAVKIACECLISIGYPVTQISYDNNHTRDWSSIDVEHIHAETEDFSIREEASIYVSRRELDNSCVIVTELTHRGLISNNAQVFRLNDENIDKLVDFLVSVIKWQINFEEDSDESD